MAFGRAQIFADKEIFDLEQKCARLANLPFRGILNSLLKK